MSRGSSGRVRIIGGRWRNTRIMVEQRAGLRPSADRVRETLFNWLSAELPGARCLDLFAGSGVLGFEALSRGAGSLTAVESHAAAVADLEALCSRLNADAVRVVHADAMAWLTTPVQPFDIVFVDPPFDSGLLEPALALLERGWLAPAAAVYVESARSHLSPGPAWQIDRHGQTRDVDYALLRRAG